MKLFDIKQDLSIGCFIITIYQKKFHKYLNQTLNAKEKKIIYLLLLIMIQLNI